MVITLKKAPLSPMARKRVMNPKLVHGDFLTAKEGTLDGSLHTVAAIGMLCNDRDFIARATGGPVSVAETARIVVRFWQMERLGL